MSITLELPKELSDQLTQEALEAQTSMEDYVVHLIQTRDAVLTRIKTGADAVAYWKSLGLLGRLKHIEDPIQYARNVRKAAETRSRN